MKRISQRHITRISSRYMDEESLIHQLRYIAKKDPAVIDKFKEYGVSLNDIDQIHIEFCELDVSAKTKDKKIYLNRTMLNNFKDIEKPAHYLVHELVHYLQQKTGNSIKEQFVCEEYLDKPSEEEAFKAQIDFQKRNESPEEAAEYVDELLDYHDIKGKKRKQKEKALLGD